MLELKTPREIDAMRVTGAFVAELLADLAGRARVGVNLLDLELRARRLIDERDAVSCYWDYAPSFGRGPFRNVVCLSVNDAVLHGLPQAGPSGPPTARAPPTPSTPSPSPTANHSS